MLSNYTGNTLVSFKHNIDDDNEVLGGNITIGSAAEGSVITLSTDNDGLDTSNAEEVTKVLNKLADKLTTPAQSTVRKIILMVMCRLPKA